jgi:hypothetical protein
LISLNALRLAGYNERGAKTCCATSACLGSSTTTISPFGALKY